MRSSSQAAVKVNLKNGTGGDIFLQRSKRTDILMLRRRRTRRRKRTTRRRRGPLGVARMLRRVARDRDRTQREKKKKGIRKEKRKTEWELL